MCKEYAFNKLMALYSIYEENVDEIIHLINDLGMQMRHIARTRQDITELSVEEHAKMITAHEDLKVKHNELIVALGDNNII